MIVRARYQPAGRSNRQTAASGFTVIELLVVVTIIIVLMTMTTAAVMRFRKVGPALATRNSIRSMKTSFDAQWSEVLGKSQKDPIPAAIQTPLATAAGATALSDPRVRAMYGQWKLAQAFPMDFTEALTPKSGLPALPQYSQYLGTLGVTSANAATAAAPEVQRAVCLMMILERGPGTQGKSADSWGSTAAQKLTLNTGVDAWACVDAFGNPLLFTRANTNMVPVILSAGADGKPGVDINTFAVTAAADAADNLSSLDS